MTNSLDQRPSFLVNQLVLSLSTAIVPSSLYTVLPLRIAGRIKHHPNKDEMKLSEPGDEERTIQLRWEL